MKLPSRHFYITLQHHWEWTGVHSGLQPSRFTSWSHEGVQPPESNLWLCGGIGYQTPARKKEVRQGAEVHGC